MNEEQIGEIKKVSRRLNLWAKPERQDQYNSQILNAYLSLSLTKKQITETDIFKKLGGPIWFQSNFVQMKSIAPKNHGKIFELKDNFITIWKPVEIHVSTYHKNVHVSV